MQNNYNIIALQVCRLELIIPPYNLDIMGAGKHKEQ